jgi:hypothetical protein
MSMMQRFDNALGRVNQPADRNADAQNAPILQAIRRHNLGQHFIE